MQPRFNEFAGDRPNLFVKWRVRYIENLGITNLRGNDQNVRYIEAIVRAALYNFQLWSFGREKMKFLKLSQMNGLDK